MRLITARFPMLLTVLLAACGGGGNGAADQASGNAVIELPELALEKLELVQTHVMPPQGRQWTASDGEVTELHLTAGRPALALIETNLPEQAGLQLAGKLGDNDLGSIDVLANDQLPLSEDDGPRYSPSALVASIPGSWVQPGLELRLVAADAVASDWQPVDVGADTELVVRNLPFYLFGADDADVPLDQASEPSAAVLAELQDKWPISRLRVEAHPAGPLQWDQLVIPPRNGLPAYVMNSVEDQANGFDMLAATLGIVRQMRAANGESSTANQYYGALIPARSDGSTVGPGGGLGGGHSGTGDHAFAGIFIHELGHGFGLPHAGESYNNDNGYPYPGGSLNGSSWGFDWSRQQFMPVLVPSSSRRFANCANDSFAGTPRQVDNLGRCIRQDPMQSGAADRADGDQFSIFADYNAARIQRDLEGVASDNGDGTYSYQAGVVVEQAMMASGYARWNSLLKEYVEYDPAANEANGLYGVRRGFPEQREVPVYTVIISRSLANTPGATQIYPLLGPWTGNLRRLFDPTVDSERAAMMPNVGSYPWYCRNRGCDYTLRVTYAGGVIRHFAWQAGFRGWFAEQDPPPATASDPTHGNSFRHWAVNIPADLTVLQVELLDTPMVWDGMPLVPTVLASR